MLFVLMGTNDYELMRSDSNLYCGIMLGISLLSLFIGFLMKYSFGIIGENVTFYLRKELYQSILIKDMSWFDIRENDTGVLTSVLSNEAPLINGAASEGFAAIL
jgi:ABC-type multidrug transport system fused ATPase/permease subunit